MKRLFALIKQSNHVIWGRIATSSFVNVKSLSMFRVMMGLFLLIAYVPSFSWIADVPNTFFNPPTLSFANLFDQFPSKLFFVVLDNIILISLICITLGIRAKVFSIIYVISCLIGLSFQYSFGKIDHSIMQYAMIGCMAFSGWGIHLAILPDKKVSIVSTARSLSLLSLLLCFAMFSAGFEKALYWLNFDLTLNGFLMWSHYTYFNDGRQFLLAPYVKFIPPLILKIIDISAVIFELSPFIFLLISRKSWRMWLCIACSFHLANTFLLNIPFVINSIVYLSFVNYNWLYNKTKNFIKHPYSRPTIIASIIAITLWRIVIAHNSYSKHITIAPTFLIQLDIYIGILIWTIALFILGKDLLTKDHPADKILYTDATIQEKVNISAN